MNSFQSKVFSAILLIIALLPITAYSQKSIGKVKPTVEPADKSLSDIPVIPVNKWVGHKFIFLEKQKKYQESGYNLYLKGQRDIELVKVNGNLIYDKFVGKIMTVQDVSEAHANLVSEEHLNYLVTFALDNSDIKIYGKTEEGFLAVEIGLVEDMDKAKKRWLGKTLYSKKKIISTYDADLDSFGKLAVKIGEPLKVIDIWGGLDEFDTLWIIVETSKKEQGYIGTAFSWTNRKPGRWETKRPWEEKDYFWEVKPQWNPDIWKLINDNKVKIGMTKEQVLASWGKPKDINKDIYRNGIQEQWIYDSQYLYFEGNKLSAMQGGN